MLRVNSLFKGSFLIAKNLNMERSKRTRFSSGVSVGKRSTASKMSLNQTIVGCGLPEQLLFMHPLGDISSLKRSQKRNTLYSAFLSLSNIGVACIDSEYRYNNSRTISLRVLTMLLSSLLVVLVFRYYNNYLHIRKLYKTVSRSTCLWEDYATFKYLAIESLISSLFVPPFFNISYTFYQQNTSVTVALSDVLAALTFLKSYNLAKVLYEFSIFHSCTAYFHCSLHNVSSGIEFVLKSSVHSHSLFFVSFLMLFISTLSGIIIYIFERTVPNSKFDEI